MRNCGFKYNLMFVVPPPPKKKKKNQIVNALLFVMCRKGGDLYSLLH